MSHPLLMIFGYGEAGMYLSRVPPPDVAGVISICGGRGECRVEADPRHRRRLDLSFDDVDVAVPGDEVDMLRAHARRRWAADNGLTEVAPNAADAAALIEFARAVRTATGVVLCHCAGGISRAPAAALICLATWEGPGREDACMDELFALRPASAPHEGLVRFADALLDRRGKLVSSLKAAIGRRAT